MSRTKQRKKHMNLWKLRGGAAILLAALIGLSAPGFQAQAVAAEFPGEMTLEEVAEEITDGDFEETILVDYISDSESSTEYPELGSEEASETGCGTVAFSTTDGVTTAAFSDDADGISGSTGENGVITVTVAKAGEYTLQGDAKNVRVEVTKGLSEVKLRLDSLNIDDTELSAAEGSDQPVISFGKNSSGTILLSGASTVSGSDACVKEGEAVIKAAQAELVMAGDGTLTLSSGTGSAFSAKKGVLRFTGGEIVVTRTGDDAVKAKDGTIQITGGTLNIENSAGDGLKAGMEDTTDGGNILISGGSVNIGSGEDGVSGVQGDGIQAENVTITDGTVNIVTVYDNAAVGYYTDGSTSETLNTLTENGSTKTERINVDTGSHKGIKTGTKAATKTYEDLKTTDPENATKTTEASGGLTISGGTVTVDTTGAGLKANSVTTGGYTRTSTGQYIIGGPDDGLQSNHHLTITGGNVTVRAGDDGIGAAGTVTISGNAVVDVQTAYEGIEAANIIIGTGTDSPTVSVNANDDGFNASSKTVSYVYQSSENEDTGYVKTSVSKTGNTCVINSGTVTVQIDSTENKAVTLRDGSATASKTIVFRADGDGVDCNGSLDIEGGTVTVFGSAENDNSPIDTDDGFTLGLGATVLEIGSSGMSGESIPRYGTGVYVTTGSAGSTGGPGAPGDQGGEGAPGTPGGEGGPGTPGGEGTPGAPGTPGGQGGEGAPGAPGTPGGNTGAAIGFSKNGSVMVKNGDTEIASATVPCDYSNAFALYASPVLTAGTEYTISNGTDVLSVTAASPSGTNPGGEPGTEPGDKPGDEPGTNPGDEPGVNPGGEDQQEGTGSGQDGNEEPVRTGTRTEEDGSVTESYTKEMVKGQTYLFGSDSTGTWTSTDPSIVRVVKKTGAATARAAGTVTLINTEIKDGKAVLQEYTVTVYEPALSLKTLTLLVGEENAADVYLQGLMAKETAASLPVSWISSNTNVISVKTGGAGKADAEGKATADIKAVGKGSARLTAWVGGKSYAMRVTVRDTAATTVLENGAAVTIAVLQGYTPRYSNGFKANGAVWTAADESGNALEFAKDSRNIWQGSGVPVTITKAGRFTGVREGTVVLTGTNQGMIQVLTLTVKTIPIKTDIYINVGQRVTLKHTGVKKTNRTEIIWSAVSDGIFSLTNTDKPAVRISGVTVGSTELTCLYTGADGQQVIYTTTVHVEDPSVTKGTASTAEGTLAPAQAAYSYTLSMKEGEIFALEQAGVFHDILWKSSNKTKVFASEAGVLYARDSKGTVMVTGRVNNKTVRIRINLT